MLLSRLTRCRWRYADVLLQAVAVVAILVLLLSTFPPADSELVDNVEDGAPSTAAPVEPVVEGAPATATAVVAEPSQEETETA